jgi:hypothetical protein
MALKGLGGDMEWGWVSNLGRPRGRTVEAGDPAWWRATQSSRQWPAVDGWHGVVQDRGDGEVDRWTQGHSNGRRCQNGLNYFKIQTV